MRVLWPRRFMGRFLCSIGDHDWTSNTQEGIPADPAKIRADPIGYFKEFSAMWCRRCEQRSDLNV